MDKKSKNSSKGKNTETDSEQSSGCCCGSDNCCSETKEGKTMEKGKSKGCC
ncbi:MAG TPA: hypothetical protein VI564_05090 [Candidatus Nanoarchaeia archaeon]|nr:hypothetical protein [Candidatus Nanoarchaeia archaeon]